MKKQSISSQSHTTPLVLIVALLTLTSMSRGDDQTSFVRTVVPHETEEPVNNPYMGWGLWAGAYNDFINTRYTKRLTVEDNTSKFGDDGPLFGWVLVDWPWSQLEPQEGQYRWEDFDAVIRYWADQGKNIVLRFWVTDDPGWDGKSGGDPCPTWVWQKGMRYREYVDKGGAKKRELDYGDPTFERIYLAGLQKLIAMFASKYDRPDTPIALCQVMGYGHWADWATWYSHYSFSSRQTKHELLDKIVHIYHDNLKHIRLFQYAGGDWDRDQMVNVNEHVYAKALDTALSNGFGLIWTGYIDGIRGWDLDMMQTYWKTNPILTEGNWCYEDMKSQLTHGTPDENLDVMLDWHSNYAHFYFDAIAYQKAMREDRAFLERGLRKGGLGYRLVPTSLAWRAEIPAGHLLVLRQSWVNRNVGRLYVQHSLKLYLTDSEGLEKFSEVDKTFNTTSLVQGETYRLSSIFHLPKDLPPANYDVRIGLVNNQGNPSINLAIQGGDGEKRYEVGTIRILPTRP